MVAIFQTTFLNAFYRTKIYEFRLRCHWMLFIRDQLTLFQHWFRQWLGAGLVTSHCLNQWWLLYWRISESLGLSELNSYNVIKFFIGCTENCQHDNLPNDNISISVIAKCLYPQNVKSCVYFGEDLDNLKLCKIHKTNIGLPGPK